MSKGSKFRKTVYQYPHEINDNNFGQASPELLLEINCFTRPSPYQQMSMQTMIADMLIAENREDLIEQYALYPFELNVLSINRTLIEKLLGLIKDSYSDNPITQLRARIRHLYDITMILRNEEHRHFIESNELESLCKLCIEDESETWNNEKSHWLKTPLNKAPLFRNIDTWWSELRSTYEDIFADLVYGDLPKFEEIKDTLDYVQANLVLTHK